MTMSEPRLIVGLGNHGKQYEYTRHNVGFMVVQHLVEQEGLKWQAKAFCQAVCSQGKIQDQTVFLFLPQTFMNNSGVAVKQIVKEKNLSLENILVVCDDFHVELGRMRLRKEGSAGGHNGLKSIIQQLGCNNFPRLRVGIGQKKTAHPDQSVVSFEGDNVVDFVLRNFSSVEKKQLIQVVDVAADCCRAWLTDDIEHAMSRFN